MKKSENIAPQMRMYLERQEELVEEYNGQIIALRDGQVLGTYPTKLAAWQDMVKRNIPDGKYIIVRCSPGEEGYTFFWGTILEDKYEH